YGSAADVVAMETPEVSVVDAAAERTMSKQLLHDGAKHKGECLLPRAAATTVDGGLLVACMGVDALVEMDARTLEPARVERRRGSVPAGPVGVAADARAPRAVVWSQFDRELAIVALDGSTSPTTIRAPELAPTKLTPGAAWGRRIFHRTDDSHISNDGRAC